MYSALTQLNIAFASHDNIKVDQHFGRSKQFYIYQLFPDQYRLLDRLPLTSHSQDNQQKIAQRLQAISDCFAVYCLACGAPVRQQLLAQGTRVVVLPKTQRIDVLIEKIQQNWPGNIALRQHQYRDQQQKKQYFDQLAESQWTEMDH